MGACASLGSGCHVATDDSEFSAYCLRLSKVNMSLNSPNCVEEEVYDELIRREQSPSLTINLLISMAPDVSVVSLRVSASVFVWETAEASLQRIGIKENIGYATGGASRDGIPISSGTLRWEESLQP